MEGNNPYLYDNYQPTGKLTQVGSPLSRVTFPIIHTSFSHIETAVNPIQLMESNQKTLHYHNIGSLPVGINLNLKPTTPSPTPNTSPYGQVGSPKVVGQQKFNVPISKEDNLSNTPQDLDEMYKNREFISGERSGGKNSVYRLEQLRAMANIAGVPATGNKETLAKNIRAAIDKWKGHP